MPPDALAGILERSIRDPSKVDRGTRSGRRYTRTGETYQKTLRLLREGFSVEEIAEERDLSPRTVSNHIVTLAANGEELDLEVEAERMKQLREVAGDWEDGDRLSPVKEALSEDWTYPMLKRHLAAMLQERQ